MYKKTGILIAIEGIDGAGKSTLASALAHQLTILNHPVILTREPGGTPLGKQLREILQKQHTPLHAKTEFLLFAADRAQHFHEVVIPALAQNNIVISDRMATSSLVYQGYGRGLDNTALNTINRWAMNERVPDIIIYLQIPYTVAQERLVKRNTPLTTFEKEQKKFLQTLVTGFDELLLNKPNCLVLDGTQAPHILANLATTYLLQQLQKLKITD